MIVWCYVMIMWCYVMIMWWSCDDYVMLCDDHVMLCDAMWWSCDAMWWSSDGHVMVMWWSHDAMWWLCGSTTYLPGVTSTLVKEGFCLWKCSGCKVDKSCSLLHFTHVLLEVKQEWQSNTLFSGSWKIPASFSHSKIMWVILISLVPSPPSQLIIQSKNTVEWMQQWPHTQANVGGGNSVVWVQG